VRPNVAAAAIDKRKTKVVMMTGIKEAPPILTAQKTASLLELSFTYLAG